MPACPPVALWAASHAQAPTRSAMTLGHVAFLGTDPRQRLEARLERDLAGEAGAVGLLLLGGAQLEELVEPGLAERILHLPDQVCGQGGVRVGKMAVGLGGGAPQ